MNIIRAKRRLSVGMSKSVQILVVPKVMTNLNITLYNLQISKAANL